MKKKNYLLAAMLLAAFTACNNESSMDMTTETPAEFTAHVGKQKVQTRMADATWDNGDCIGIFALKDDCAEENYPGPEGTSNAYANGKYKYDGSKWNFDDSGDLKKPYYFKNPYTTVVTFKAYYPWQPNTNITAAGDPSKIDNGTIAVDASQDQSSDAQKKYDFLFAGLAPTEGAKETPNATNTEGKPWGSKESTNVQFQFTHSMVKLVFVLQPGTDNGVTLEDVKSMTPFLEGIKSKGKFSLANGEVTVSDDDATNLELKNKAEVSASGSSTESVQFVAIVVPQETPQNAILRLQEPLDPSDSGNDTYITKKLFSNLGDDGLQAGHQYTYTLTVKKMELVIESFGITPWQNTNMTDADDAVLQ